MFMSSYWSPFEIMKKEIEDVEYVNREQIEDDLNVRFEELEIFEEG